MWYNRLAWLTWVSPRAIVTKWKHLNVQFKLHICTYVALYMYSPRDKGITVEINVQTNHTYIC